MLTTEEAKSQAKRLRTKLTALGVQLSHSQALDGIAAAHSFRDWNTASALLPAERTNPATDETAEQLTDRINQFAKTRAEAAKALSPEEYRERLLAGRAFSEDERVEIETLLHQLGSASKSSDSASS